MPAFANRSHMSRLCSAILSFIAWASYRIAHSAQVGNEFARPLAPGARRVHNLIMRSKQTLKADLTRSKRRPPLRPRLRAAQPTGPTGSATRDRLVEAALTTRRQPGFPR